MILPFAIALLVFGLVALSAFRRSRKGSKPLTLDALRIHMDHYADVCRAIAAERIRARGLTGEERTASLARQGALEAHRARGEAAALALREQLVKAGFGMGTAQLFTVDDAEKELLAEQARPKA